MNPLAKTNNQSPDGSVTHSRVRQVADCPYRRGESGDARCQLTAVVSGARDPALFKVSEAFCEGCCRLPLPSPDHLNPIVASLLFELSLEVIKRGGDGECDLESAKKLRVRAIENLERVYQPFTKFTPPDYKRPCFYLGDQTGERTCKSCAGSVRIKQYDCRHEWHGETDIRFCQSCADYEPSLTTGAVRDWAVGLTTAPRKRPTLDTTYASLRNAGWKREEICVFAEPSTEIPKALEKSEVVLRKEPRLGAWSNWLLSLTELTLRFPQADAYFLCQDDTLLAGGLRVYLEDTLWPSERLGVVSLHTPSHFARSEPDGYFAVDVGWSAWGAMGFVFPNAAARALLRHPVIINHRNRGRSEGMQNIDSVVGEWCQQTGLEFIMHSPSLTQHTGATSTLWGEKSTLEGRRSASDFPGENVDIAQFMKNGHLVKEPG